MAARQYRSTVQARKLDAAITTSGQTTITLDNTNGLPSISAGQTFTLVISPDTATEEIVTVTAYGSGNTLTVIRGEDGTTAQGTHALNTPVKHMITARDLQEPQTHIAASSAVHGVTGSVVGTSDAQTLTNKTLTSPTINTPTITAPTVTGTATLPSTTSIGTVSATEIGYLDGVTSSIQTQFNALEAFPKGMVSPYAGASAPTGWLLCDGAAVSRTTYASLYGVVGDTYGAGDGTTTFNVPNLKGRVIVGIDGADSDFNTRGETGGWKATQAHTHDLSSHTHSDDHVHGVYGAGGHDHNIKAAWTSSTTHDHAQSPYGTDRLSEAPDRSGAASNNATDSVGNHAHSLNFKSEAGYGASTGGPSNNSSGSFGTGALVGATNGNLQPYMALHYIIKH